MTDRELLELAAKAAGYEFIRWETDEDGVDLAVVKHGYWQPLHTNTTTSCDGDALRLAVKLGMLIDDIELGHMAGHIVATAGPCMAAYEPRDPDPYAATRRAIVRAAAEIGRAMK